MINNYLEYWIHTVIRNQLDTDAEFRNFVANRIPDRLTRLDVEAYQLFKLRRTLQYSYKNSSFYHDLFEKAGIKPDAVRNLTDLAGLPFTEPEHLADAPYRFLCLSRAEIARPYSFVTSGTTGPQKKIFWTQGDLAKITDFMAAGMGVVAGTKDIVLILLPDGRPSSQADLLYKGVRKLGATPVAASMDLDAGALLKIIEETHCTVIFGYTGRIFRLSVELQAKHDLCEKGVRVLFLAAEYLPDARRQELERMWNCRVHTHYGLTEMGLGVAVECEARNGYHFNEINLLLEVIDPRTGEPVDQGEEGELVFTTLTREAMPLIRYRTHDLSRLVPEPCPCGANTLLRIDRIRKRLESIVIIGDGDEMYPALFDDVLFEINGLIDYQVILIRQGNRDRLDFRIEAAPERTDILPAIRERLMSTPIVAKNITAGKMVEPGIELVPWGALQSASRAKKMIVDRR
jgi:phenylacetate-CoA ligase